MNTLILELNSLLESGNLLEDNLMLNNINSLLEDNLMLESYKETDINDIITSFNQKYNI